MSVFLQRLGLLQDGLLIPASGSELITIPSDHGSREYDILTINGVSVEEFSFLQIACRGITYSGGTTVRLGVRVSTDGGSTWINGSTDYRNMSFDAAASTVVSESYAKIAYTNEIANCSAFLSNFNAEMETTVIGQGMVIATGDNNRHASIIVGSAVAHNGLQLWLEAASGTPLFTGGTIDITGYK